jgi:hypothetical protein
VIGKIKMTNRLPAIDDNFGRYIVDILKYLENDKTFSLLSEEKPKPENFYRMSLQHKLKRIPTEDDLHREGKKFVQGFDLRYELSDLLARFGETREEILGNLAREVMKSQKSINVYKEFLRRKLGEVENQDNTENLRVCRNPALEGRFNRPETQTNSMYSRIKLEELDSLYLNIFGGNN